jgi:hypothetical protein
VVFLIQSGVSCAEVAESSGCPSSSKMGTIVDWMKVLVLKKLLCMKLLTCWEFDVGSECFEWQSHHALDCCQTGALPVLSVWISDYKQNDCHCTPYLVTRFSATQLPSIPKVKVALKGNIFNDITMIKSKLWDAVSRLTVWSAKDTTLKGKTLFRMQVLLWRSKLSVENICLHHMRGARSLCYDSRLLEFCSELHVQITVVIKPVHASYQFLFQEV